MVKRYVYHIKYSEAGRSEMRKYFAEFIGTFVLTFFGCGTAVITKCSTDNYPGYILTALAFGLAVTVMFYAIGDISGCHINPAVSFAMFLRGKLTGKDFAGYIIAQLLGALAAGGFLFLMFGAESGLGANSLYIGSISISLVIEGLLTFVLVLAVLGIVAKNDNVPAAGIVIGITYLFVNVFGIGLTGASVNPARSLGPAVFAGGDALINVWVFIVAPLIGAAAAAVVHGAFYRKKA